MSGCGQMENPYDARPAGDGTRSRNRSSSEFLSGNAPNPDGTLSYFSREVDGRLYNGRFRLLGDSRVEVIARGEIASADCNQMDPLAVAGELLAKVVREAAARAPALRLEQSTGSSA